MSNTNRYRDTDDRHSWTPYNEDRHERRWEDTRMGMGDQWRGGDDRARYRNDHGWEANDFRVPNERAYAHDGDRRDWRGPHEMSRAERTNRGPDDGSRYADDERRSYNDHRFDDQRYERFNDQRFRDDRGYDSDDEDRGYGHEDRDWRAGDRDTRDWRPEQQRAMHDRDTQHRSMHRDHRDDDRDWRRSDEQHAQGDWRREQRDWRPAHFNEHRGNYRSGADDRWREHASRRNERDWHGANRDSRGGDRNRDGWRGNETRSSHEDYRRGSYGRDNPDARYSMGQRDWRRRR